MRKQIINARVVTPNKIIENGVVGFGHGVIDYVGCEKLSADVEIDAEGAFVMAGLVDIHCHGGAGYDFMDATPEEMRKISDFHLRHGTTTLVATTMTDTYESIFAALDNFSALGEDRLTLHGVHLEGPWLSPEQCGAQDVSKMAMPDSDMLKKIKAEYPFVERISAAPELDGGMMLGCTARELGIIASIAHTDADFDTTLSAVESGYTLVTHLYSGMQGVHRRNAYRTAGVVEGALYSDALTVELIADGKHLPVNLLRYVYKIKGADSICLVTDAMRGAGFPDGKSTVLGKMKDGVACIIDDGVAKLPDRQSFAGSTSTADRLLRVMHLDAKIPLPDCSKMLSLTPSRAMGHSDRGALEIGKRADIILLDEKMNINKIFLKGIEYAT